MQPKSVAFRKRAQIAQANRMMFLWVAVVSVVLGFALVGSIFLAQMLMFNERVLQEKDNTIKILDSNNNNVNSLESEIRALDANQALIDSKARPEDRALQVVLDALPSEANAEALGASLQNKLLVGATLTSLQVDSVSGSASNGKSSGNEIAFRFSLAGDEKSLQQVLRNLERSIRTIDIVSLKIENQGGSRVLSVSARAFYEPKVVVQLKDKLVK